MKDHHAPPLLQGLRICRQLSLMLLCLASANAALAAPPAIGALIFTPQERAAILKARRAVLSPQQPEAATSRSVRLDGILMRPEGAWAWFDGRRFQAGEVPFPGLGPLAIDAAGARLGSRRLKPAERLEIPAEQTAYREEGKETLK